MKTNAVVATDLAANDVVERATVIESAAVDDVGFERVEEGLDESVVADLARALHALGDPKSGGERA